MKLNNKIIMADIAGFEHRIAVAKVKLTKLQESSPSNWKEKKRLKAKQSEFEGEITHVENLISIARSALNPTDCQPGQP